MVVQACYPSAQDIEQRGFEFKASLGYKALATNKQTNKQEGTLGYVQAVCHGSQPGRTSVRDQETLLL